MTGQMPPFGDQVARLLSDPEKLRQCSGSSPDGTRGTVWVLTGDDALEMHRSMKKHVALILPAGANPTHFRWDFLSSHCPIQVWCDSLDTKFVDDVWTALKRDGCDSAVFGNGEWLPALKTTENTA